MLYSHKHASEPIDIRSLRAQRALLEEMPMLVERPPHARFYTKTCVECSRTLVRRKWYGGPLCEACYTRAPERVAHTNARGRKNSRKLPNRYRAAKQRAKTRGLTFSLSFDEWCKLVTKPCHYCSAPLPSTGVGLDRRDNARGYHTDNVLPCCTGCQADRWDRVTVEEQEQRIKLLQQLRGKTHVWQDYSYGKKLKREEESDE